MADDIAKLRDDYEAKFGSRPFNGWKADELKRRIAEGPAPAPSQADANEIRQDASETQAAAPATELSSPEQAGEPSPSQAQANEIQAEVAVEEPKATADNPAASVTDAGPTTEQPFPSQADLDAMRAGTFKRYLTR